MSLLGTNMEIINKIKAATIIVGPEAVLNSREPNSPSKTDIMPPIIDNTTI